MKKLRLKMQNLKLTVKLISIIIITCVMLLIMEILGRQNVYDTYDEQLYMKTAQVCISYASQLEMEVAKIENVSFSIIGDVGIQEKLTILKDDTENFHLSEKKDIGDAITGYCSLLKYNVKAGILLPNNEWIGSVGKLNAQERYVKIALEKKGKTTVYTQDNMIGIFREIRQISGLTMEHLGILFVQVNLNDLMRDLEYSYAKVNAMPDVFVFSGEDCIYASTKEKVQPPFVKKAMLVEDRFLVPYISSKLGWSIIVSIPYGEINESMRVANVRATILCVMVAIFICMLGCYVVCSMMPHINYLMDKFELFGNGIIPKAEEYPSYEGRMDEFGRLHNLFDKMVLDYQRLSEESYENMMLLKEAQFQQLQQQIRPHFLFNTLSTIVWTAAENDDMETAKIADALGRILRSSFQNVNNLVTVREEIKVVRDYLYIQELRYQERLQVEEKLDVEVLDVKIPSFTIQPIVENAIIHVVEKSLEPCVIRITGHVCGEELELVVEDNGGSLDEDILRKLEMGEVCPKGNGLGLSNVDKRIRLAFSEEYGLSFSSKKGCTRVTIRIPYTTSNVLRKADYKND